MSAEDITWENVSSLVLRDFPELLREDLVDKIGGFEWDPGPYTIFGSLFNQHIREAASSESEERAKVGAFLERMAESEIMNIEELLQIEVLPTLLSDQRTLEAYWQYLGPRTRRFISFIAAKIASAVVLPE